MTIDNNTLSLNILPHSANGDFAKSDNSTISVTTNNYSGYTLSIAASSSTDLLNTADNTKTISSISSATSESDFSADTTTAATNYNGKWGYLPSKFNSSDNTSFRPAPGTGDNGHTLDVTSSANATTPNTYTLAIAARVDNTTAPGSYSNTFIVSAVANLINYSITYNKGNTTDTVTNLPGNTTGTITDPLTGTTNVTLSSTIPTRNGYNFLGWCTTNPVAGTGTNPDTCSGTTIQASGTYNLNAAANPNVTIYALWQEIPKEYLYDKVAAMSKGTQTLAELQAVITTPTSSDPSTDTSNSGVYEYNASLFGTASDASNNYKIYYYRGILDSNLDGTASTYGSNGDGAYYPNYVKLGNTCWRIVRTTGSGGVKMIYNGLYSSGTTANSCANATTNAQVTTQAFGLKGNSSQSTYWYRNINRVGYTFNNTSSLQDSTTSTSVDTVFGSNSNYSTINTANSNIKDYIENTWFTGSNGISAYESILEPSAGYCNDRTAFSNTAGTTTLSTIPPYATSSATMYFGAYARNRYAGGKLSLTCPASRNTVDLYTTASASGGNKQLAKPVALLTADEAALAGSGYNSTTGGTAASTFSSNYSYSSYLRSGSDFWLLSPGYRYSGGYAAGFTLYSGGYLYSYSVGGPSSVRPAISLKEGTEVSSGSGTATDPWVIEEPKTMQSVTSSDLATLMPNEGDATTLHDARDGQKYTIAKLADGKYWMTTNLNLAGGTTLNASDSNVPSDNYYTLPASSTSGFSSDTTAYVYNSGNTTSTCTGSGCYSYYSWLAATAGGKDSSGNAVSTNGYNAAYSICPKGWRLPTSTTSNASATSNNNWKTGDFYALATAYGANLESDYYQSAATFYNNAGPGTTPNFLLAGNYGNGSFGNGGSGGRYWSSTANSSTYAYYLSFDSGGVYSANSGRRRFGYSVRCVYGS